MSRVLFVGRTRYRLPLPPGLARKFDALRERLEIRVLAGGAPGAHGDETFRLARPAPLADGAAFYASLPLRVARELRAFRPAVVIAESPFEGAAALAARALARSDAKIVVEVHGDWQASTRLYGSRGRRLASPVADRVALLALRRADALRAISPHTAGLLRSHGLEPAAVFPTYSDLSAFTGPPAPLPDRPQALFVGALEGPKNVDGLVAAWRRVAPRLPSARLHLVGDGSLRHLAEALVRELPAQAAWTPRLDPPEVAAELDRSWLLVLPSRSEGLGRVVIEALARGRAVVGSRVGGIADIVEEDVSGVLVAPGDDAALADALVALLSDRALAARLGGGARGAAGDWATTPEEFAQRVVELVEAVR